MEEIRDITLGKGAGHVLGEMRSSGFQASNLYEAAGLIERMKKEKTTVFFGFTANLVASGVRGIIKEACRLKFPGVVVTTAGAIEHDIMKGHKPYLKGSFEADDVELHRKGINRIGNIFVPNERYVFLEKFVQKEFREIYGKQKCISPRELNERFGRRLKEDSFLYWCSRNKIPVFCPGITDGAIGLQMYFFKQEHKDFCVDVTGDMKELADITLNAEKTSAVIFGGGITKHHIIGANLIRDGLDYAVYFTTAQEFDGSLSGAQTREAKSWGKIRENAKSVTVYGDASISAPLVFSYLREKGFF